MLSWSGLIYEYPAVTDSAGRDISSHDFKVRKNSAKPALEPYMDGVVEGKSINYSEDPEPVVIYHLYVRTSKGILKKFETTEENYSVLEKGYSVHYKLVSSRTYKLVGYKAPE